MRSGLRHSPSRRAASMRASRTRAIAFALVALLAAYSALPALRPAPAEALTSTTITIDGNLSDWIAVRNDPDNIAVDTQIPGDPDYPSQADRDIYYVNATYDATYLYLAWRRTAGGTKAISWGAYLDLNGDGLLQDSDRVVIWTVSTGNPYDSQGVILHYHQAQTKSGNQTTILYPGGDPMGGDGDTPDGWARVQDGADTPAMPMDGYISPSNGIEAEARVAWSDLGFAPGQIPPVMAIHFASGNGESWGTKDAPSNTWKWIGSPPEYIEENRGQVEDNVGPLYWLRARGVSVTPNNVSGAPAGTTVTYTHTITNSGNAADTFDLSALSSQGWTAYTTLPNGTPVTSIPLAARASATVQVHVVVPGGTPDGVRDVTTLRAISRTDLTVTGFATDTTSIGAVTVTPNQAGTMAPGQTITYRHTITNNQPSAGTFGVTALSSQGWTTALFASDGVTPLSSVALAAGESREIVVKVSVPAGASNGTQDITRVRATLQGDPSTYGEAEDATTVRSALAVHPDRASFGGAGTVVSYQHTVTNSWPSARTINLSALSSRGWNVQFFDSTGLNQISSVSLGPNGASTDVWVRITVPPSATYGMVDTTTITASAPVGGHTATAVDTTTIRQLATYDSGGYVNQDTQFVLGETIYGRGMGLAPASDVFFVWRNPSGTIVRTSPDRKVDTQGMAFDNLTSTAASPIGIWTLEMYAKGATPGVTTPLERTNFTLTYDAKITALSATNASTVGASTTVNCSTKNNNAVAIADSTMTYVIWWDSNADGVFNAGDTYMDATGAPRTYAGGSVSSHVTSGVSVAAGGTWSDPGWSMVNTQFPNQGTYKVTATWTDTNGIVIDRATSEFFSIPTLGWPLFLIAAIVGVAYLWRRVRTPGADVPRRVRA